MVNIWQMATKIWRVLSLICAAHQTLQAFFGFARMMDRIDSLEETINRLADPCDDEPAVLRKEAR